MSWESQLSPQEVNYYQQLFQSASQSQEGIVTGTEAVRFFASSGVPNEILSEIWEAADRDKVGYLTPENFAIALKLIACAQHGIDANANVLSTAVPLPQFEGVNIIAPSPVVANTAAEAPITAAEREKYLNIFKVHQPVNGILDGNTAKNVFVKSKLPIETLGQIWNLADTRQSGTLNQAEFIIAMHYIAKLMDGSLTTLPDKLPPAVFQSANIGNTITQSPLMRNMTVSSPSFRQSTMTPPQRARTIDSLGNLAFGSPAPSHEPLQQWDVTPQEKQQFDTYFDKIDSQKRGLIQGKEAVEFFNNSRLPDHDLAHIWDLADIQQRGALSREEFAIAMHLIHKRLAGENLPQSLPKSLLPPSNTPKPIPQQSPFGTNSPMAQPRAIGSPAPVRDIFDDSNASADLLGDFSNDQVSHETNQLNLLQNQITSLSTQTTGLQQQKVSAESTLEQLLQQKKELEAQLTNVRMSHEASVKELNEVQEIVRREEGEWDKVRSEYDAAQQQLTTLQNEIAQAKQTLENGRAETEGLRRRVHEIQEETAQVNAELDKLRAQTKQQGMMLDINRRQVTAAEQDRAQAKRNLEDYKAAGNFNEESSESEEETTPAVEKSPEPAAAASSVVSTPALNNLFSPVPEHENKPSSPFDVFATAVSPTTTAGDDFDAIFGNLSVSSPTTPQTFDTTSWATTTPPSAKSTRGPPPPPPQSRHHRQPSESLSVTSTTSSITKKQRAPPPPPSTTSLIPETNNEDDDDFEAAFSGSTLPEAKVVTAATKDDEFADFDDAFSAFDSKAAPTANTNTEWASSFGGFNFGDEPKPKAAEDDWDAIFGTPTKTNAETAGFDDAFSSFGNDDFGKQTKKPSSVNHIGIVGDKIEELVKMGFNETEAKDALNRYDQDLEKASNFLLDQSK